MLAGLCFGSFAGVIIYRVPRGISIVSPPSRCENCETRLGLPEILPVAGWIISRGRCKYCGVKISPRYVAVEIFTAGMFLISAVLVGFSFDIFAIWALLFILICVSAIDFKTLKIPDGLLITGAIIGAAWVFSGIFIPGSLAPDPVTAALGAIAGGAPIFFFDRLTFIVSGRDGFGFGDVKLMAVCGFWLGWQGAFFALFCAVIAGGAAAMVLLFSGREKLGAQIPFAPFLSMGTAFSLFWNL